MFLIPKCICQRRRRGAQSGSEVYKRVMANTPKNATPEQLAAQKVKEAVAAIDEEDIF